MKADDGHILEVTSASTEFLTIAATTITIFENSNPQSTLSISQNTFQEVSVQGSGLFRILQGGIKSASFTSSSIRYLSGGAQLFEVASSQTAVEVD